MTIPARFEWTRQPGIGPGVEVLGPLDGRVVIEMGCGSGHNLAHLAAVRGAIGIGIDRDPAKVDRARGLYGQTDNLAFILGDVTDVLAAMPRASADVCLSIFGALSFSPPGPILSEAARVLRPPGRLAVTMRADAHRDYVAVLTRKDAEGADGGNHRQHQVHATQPL